MNKAKICFVFLLFVLGILGCGGTETATKVGEVSDAEMSEATEGSSEAKPEATQEALPTEVAEFVIEPEDFKRGYGTLLIFDLSTLIVEGTAKQLADDEIDGLEAFGRLLVVGAMFKAVNESLSAEAPHEAFEASWEEAGEILPVVGDVVRRWGDKEIKSDEVLEELVGPREQIDEMMESLDEILVSEYGGDAAALAQFREETAAEFQANLESSE